MKRKKVVLLVKDLEFHLQVSQAQDGSIGGIKLLYEKPPAAISAALIRLKAWLNKTYTWETLPPRVRLTP